MNEKVIYWINYYKQIGIGADYCSSNTYFLLYNLKNNEVLINFNFPKDQIPKQLKYENRKDNI